MDSALKFVSTNHPHASESAISRNVLDAQSYAGYVCEQIKSAKGKKAALAIMDRVMHEGADAIIATAGLLEDMNPTSPKRGKPARATKPPKEKG